MSEPVKITFDKNVYEFVVDPNKPAKIPDAVRNEYKRIHELIIQKKITPFISEFLLTYEVLAKDIRQDILQNTEPLLFQSDGERFTISSNPKLHPGNHPKDDLYLEKAIDLGFKILPGKRFGKLINPAIKSDWYYFLDEDYMETSQRFADIVKFIDSLGVGHHRYQEVSGIFSRPHLKPFENIKAYQGSKKKLSEAISEWSDGDSVALHLAYGLDYFCTNDHAKNAGTKSVFSPAIQTILLDKFNFRKVIPGELVNLIK